MKIQVILSSVVVMFVASGCASYMQESREAQAREAHKQVSMGSDVAMLKERLKGIEMAQEQLAQDILEIRQAVSKSSSSNAELSSKLGQVVKALELRDEEIQKKTIDILSKKIADILKAQGSSGPSAVYATGVEHVVESGQTLSAIAQAYGVTVSAIVKANKLTNPNSVRAGQKLFIPR